MAAHGPNDAFAAVAVVASSAVIVGHNLVYAHRENALWASGGAS